MRFVSFAAIAACLSAAPALAQEPQPAPVPGESLRDRAAPTQLDGRYTTDQDALPPLRLPKPFVQVEWPLPAEAYAQAAAETAPITSPVTSESPPPAAEATPEPTPEPAPVATPSPEPTPVASPAQPELGAPISGILYLPGGVTPASKRLAELVNTETGRVVATTMTAEDGSFTFPPQAKGPYEVRVGRKVRRPD
jgi:hypothetical protein